MKKSAACQETNLQALTQLQDAHRKLFVRGAQPDHQDSSLNPLILLWESSL